MEALWRCDVCCMVLLKADTASLLTCSSAINPAATASAVGASATPSAAGQELAPRPLPAAASRLAANSVPPLASGDRGGGGGAVAAAANVAGSSVGVTTKSACASSEIKYITRTTHSEALIVRGTGYDVACASSERRSGSRSSASTSTSMPGQ
jgi:hypothetical protein